MMKDHDIFFDIINAKSKVMEVGCGNGNFMRKLKLEKNCKVSGLEIDYEKVANALEKGLSVVQGDADNELKNYPDKDKIENPFDYLVLANSLQVMKKPKEVLIQAKRISRKTLVSIPNFGYYKNRLYLALRGKMPVTSKLSYEWYETPNIHFSTIRDFIELAEKIGFNIEDSYYLRGYEDNSEVSNFKKSSPQKANLLGHSGIFVLS